jgi:hypothetical protein
MNRLPVVLSGFVVAAMLIACVTTGETGDELVTFNAFASGPTIANGGHLCGTNAPKPLVFSAPNGFQVTLNQAAMTVGAVYLVEGQYNGGSANTSCFENGTYAGQVPGAVGSGLSPLGLNVLCPDLTAFSVHGNGSADLAGVGQVWLTGGLHTCFATAGGTSCPAAGPDINALVDPTPIVQLQGVATNGTVSYRFQATVTIQQANRGLTTMPGLPGDNPICSQRIVTVTPIAVQLYQGGAFYLTVDPRGWLSNVDFTQPPCLIGGSGGDDGGPDSGGAGDGESGDGGAAASVCNGLQQISGEGASAVFEIPDTNDSTIGNQLYTGITSGTLPSGASLFAFRFGSAPP